MSANKEPHKDCIRCKIKKLISDFGPSKSTRDKLQVWCRGCLKEYSNAHYQQNKDKYNKRRRDLWKEKGV